MKMAVDYNNDAHENDNEIGFSCPQGVSICYRADGSQYLDVNSLSAAAAGHDDGENHEGSAVTGGVDSGLM